MKIAGAKLAEVRQAKFKSRSELAAIADLTHARIWQIETSDVAHVNDNIAKAMAAFLDVPVEELCPTN